MKIIRTDDHLSTLRQIAKNYSLSLEAIDVVPDIKSWCEEHNVPETSPWRAGKCLRNRKTGTYRILLAKEISPDIAVSIIDAVELKGFKNEVHMLQNDRHFLMHLLLHEMAHAMNPTWSEDECDSWAFKELHSLLTSKA